MTLKYYEKYKHLYDSASVQLLTLYTRLSLYNWLDKGINMFSDCLMSNLHAGQLNSDHIFAQELWIVDRCVRIWQPFSRVIISRWYFSCSHIYIKILNATQYCWSKRMMNSRSMLIDEEFVTDSLSEPLCFLSNRDNISFRPLSRGLNRSLPLWVQEWFVLSCYRSGHRGPFLPLCRVFMQKVRIPRIIPFFRGVGGGCFPTPRGISLRRGCAVHVLVQTSLGTQNFREIINRYTKLDE